MKNFSMFEQALKLANSAQTEDLGFISNISRRTYDERETFMFRSQGACLEYLSLLIENALLLRTNRRGRIYAGFEKFRAWRRSLIATCASQISPSSFMSSASPTGSRRATLT